MDTKLILFVLANLAITAGYFFVAWKIAPHFIMEYLYTKIGGVFFFILCGFTHIQMAYDVWRLMSHMHVDWFTVGYHIAQAVAVWTFVIGLYREFIVERRSAFVEKSSSD